MDACNHPGAPRRRWESYVKRFMKLRETDLKPRKSYEIGDGLAAALHNRLREAIANRKFYSEKDERLHRMAKEKVEKMKKEYRDVIKTTPEDEKIAGCDSSEDEEVAHKIAGLTLDV